MKKYILVGLFFLLVGIIPVYAQQGCCSHHGGVGGCNSYGRTICKDGTLSPTCTCAPQIIYGCTDSSAKNYNKNANQNDGSCIYYKKGCTDKNALNYDINAEKDDGTCITKITGCMDEAAINYNPEANSAGKCYYDNQNKSESDGSIVPGVLGVGLVGTVAFLVKKRKVKLF